MTFLAINTGKLFTKIVETRQRFSFVHVSLGIVDEKACSSLVYKTGQIPYFRCYSTRLNKNTAFKYSCNNVSLSVKVKITYSEAVESVVCFMIVVLFPTHMEFSVLTGSRPALGHILPPILLGTRSFIGRQSNDRREKLPNIRKYKG